MDKKVVKWRSSPLHRKCMFCKYLTIVSRIDGHSDYYKCLAKEKIVNDGWPDMTLAPRPFCKLFELDVEDI